MKVVALVALVACGSGSDSIEATKPTPLVPRREVVLDTGTQPHRRMVQPEQFLRAYLTWFGGLSPSEVQKQAGRGLFDQWNDYIGALGLPDYRIDVPRAGQSNPLMLAAIARLGEALCVRASEHDLAKSTPLADRQIFAFDANPSPTLDEFAKGFDTLHRTFLGYPAALAPPARVGRFYALYQKVQTETQTRTSRSSLAPVQAGWAAVCTALIQHPEAQLY